MMYLDHAAATPMDERVFAVMRPFMDELFYNPSSPYAPAVAVRRDYEEAKHRLAKAIGGKSDDIIMTAGATESINIIFSSAKGKVITNTIEHHAVLMAAAAKGATFVSVGESGVVNPDDIAKAITNETSLISLGLANNELGTIQPIRAVAELVKKERRRRLEAGETMPLYLHTDASQGVGQIDIHVARLGVDAMTLNAGKIYGPKQVGLLWVSPQVELNALIVGGGQERGIRSGTENVAGTIGFATALELAVAHKNSEAARLTKLRDSLERELLAAFPDAVITGAKKKRLPGHLHISFPGVDAERLVFALERQKVLVATGSACAANKGTRSHVLTAVGLSDDVADGSLRLTLGRMNDEATIARAAGILIEVIEHEIKRSGV
jgi:cysteine desulfurase